MKVLILCPYPEDSAASQRFRFERFRQLPGLEFHQRAFWSKGAWRRLYLPGRVGPIAFQMLGGFLRRFLLLFTLHRYHGVLIHREAAPLGPPLFEWLIARVWRKKIIYDFDDAIWLPNTSAANRMITPLKCHWKVKWICRWAYRVSCGNAFLADYARQYNRRVSVIPTVVDTRRQHNRLKDHRPGRMTVGWTGSHSTLRFLQPLVPVLQELEREFSFDTLVIADQDPALPLQGYRFRSWQRESEIEDLLEIDIGLMPLDDSPWAFGKCGFKAIQYLALGIPAVVSPVGVNSQIVKEGHSGRLCRTSQEWKMAIQELLEDFSLREKMGKEGRAFIEQHYSVKAWKDAFRKLFD